MLTLPVPGTICSLQSYSLSLKSKDSIIKNTTIGILVEKQWIKNPPHAPANQTDKRTEGHAKQSGKVASLIKKYT